jgi:hypothetical protein
LVYIPLFSNTISSSHHSPVSRQLNQVPFPALQALVILLTGIVQRNLRGIGTAKLRARQIFILNFKGTPSQEEHKTIISGLKIDEMALSDQIDFPAFLRLHKMT